MPNQASEMLLLQHQKEKTLLPCSMHKGMLHIYSHSIPWVPWIISERAWHFTFLEWAYLYIKCRHYLLYLFHGHATCQIMVYYRHMILGQMYIKFHICCSLEKIEKHTEQNKSPLTTYVQGPQNCMQVLSSFHSSWKSSRSWIRLAVNT